MHNKVHKQLSKFTVISWQAKQPGSTFARTELNSRKIFTRNQTHLKTGNEELT